MPRIGDELWHRRQPFKLNDGGGHHSAFKCAQCQQHKNIIKGRRKVRIKGVMQFICASCFAFRESGV